MPSINPRPRIALTPVHQLTAVAAVQVEELTVFTDMLKQLGLLDDIQYSKSNRAAEEVATKRGAMAAQIQRTGGVPRARQAPIGSPLPSPLALVMTSAEPLRPDTRTSDRCGQRRFESHPASAASCSGRRCSVAPEDSPHPEQSLRPRPAQALPEQQRYSLIRKSLYRGRIVEGNAMKTIQQWAKPFFDTGISGGGQCCQGAAMKCAVHDDNARLINAALVANLTGNLDGTSFASAPELQKKTRSIPVMAMSLSASSDCLAML